MELDLGRIIRFKVVAEEMSFSRAAKRLHVDQAWLSRQILQLEDRLGFSLLNRTTRTMALTAEGELFFREAQQLSQLAKHIGVTATSLRDKLHSHLRIGVSPVSIWQRERMALFADFHSKYPAIQIEIKTSFTPHMLSALESQDLDLAITTPFADRPTVDYIAIHRSRPGLLVRSDSALSYKEELLPDDVRGRPVAVIPREENPLLYDQLYQPFLDCGMVPRIVPEGRLAMFQHAMHEGILMLGFQREDMSQCNKNLLYRNLRGCNAQLEVGVARQKGDERPGVLSFWAASLRRQLSAAAVG
jgi:DNA-binding transcriptional LysR family regulator